MCYTAVPMGRYDRPLPKDVTDGMFDQWASVIRRRECASIMQLPCSDRHYRVAQFLRERSRTFRDVQTHAIMLQSLVTEEPGEFEQKLRAFGDPHGHQMVFFVLDGEWLITAAPNLLPLMQHSTLEPYRRTSFLLFFERNMLHEDTKRYVQTCPSLFQNVFYQPLYLRAAMVHFMRHMAFMYGYSLSSRQQEDIWDRCRGYIWLVTEALRNAHRTGSLSFTHEAMMFRLSAIWNGFSSEEQRLLKLITRNHGIGEEFGATVPYLDRTALVQEKTSGHPTITVPILADYIRELDEREQTLVLDQEGNLLVNTVRIASALSPRERELATHFVVHKGELVSRETAAAMLWGDRWEDTYTDWALDQAVRRLRNKLQALGLPQASLQTVKGKGYRFRSKL